MIMLTFDGAVNLNNYELYKRVFNGIKNPNGCPIRGTFFISHEYRYLSNFHCAEWLFITPTYSSSCIYTVPVPSGNKFLIEF